MKLAVHWFRRDLRVTDNTALHFAFKRAEKVIPVFIAEDALKTGPDVGERRVAFLLRAVENLRRDLKSLGHTLIVREGKSESEIPKLARELGAHAVFANKRYEPYAIARDARIFNALNATGVGFELFKDAVIWDDREILTGSDSPYTVFTPYAKAWKARRIPPPVPALGKVPKNDAQKALDRFVDLHLANYKTNRDFPALDATSRLSPHLRAGTIGIRTVLQACRGNETFLNELIWREFYLQILTNFPHVARGSFRREYDAFEWENNNEHFDAWKTGQTGYPLVDAAMRCLNATGWMHNRLRMIVAMFLTKDLLVSWQWGERYFMQQLVDGDMAANNGGWQWSAGTGTDAAPYFRIFNPITQSRKFDPDGAFIRQWLPEADPLDPHDFWKKPIVDHAQQRTKCLAMYARIKRPSGKT